MASSNKPLLVILGITGAQGGSVFRAVSKDNKYRIRGITRDVNSQKAKDLSSQGVEMISGNVNNKEDLLKAFQGADSVFAVTNFWDPSQMGKEAEIGKKMNEAAKEAGVKQYIFSSLANVKAISNGKYHVPHFTDKALVEEHAKSIGLNSVFVGAAFYYQNFRYFFPPTQNEKGELIFTLPIPTTGFITAFDVEDTGEPVRAILNNFEQYKGKFVPLCGDHLHPNEYIDIFSKVTGKIAKLNAMDAEAYGKLGFPGADELAQMFSYFNDYTYFGPNSDLQVGKKLHPKMKTYEQYLETSGWKGEK